jgi:hypothetical protein
LFVRLPCSRLALVAAVTRHLASVNSRQSTSSNGTAFCQGTLQYCLLLGATCG